MIKNKTNSSFSPPSEGLGEALKRRGKEDNLYVALQKQSLEMVQQLSGDVWTDYNEHDPGVTLMDTLNYALFETNYQQEFEFEEYLGNPQTGNLINEQAGFFSASEVFAPAVVTPADYEKLIEEQIPGINKCRVSISDANRYIIEVELKDGVDSEPISRAISALYHANRNLAENLSDIRAGKWDAKTANILSKKKDIVFRQDNETLSIAKKVHTTYHSVQYDLPDAYAINERGLPPHASDERKAKAMQLKAYLLLYDYLLSGVSQQRKNIHRLFDLSGKLPAPFSFDMDIPGINRLIDSNLTANAGIFTSDETDKQKLAYFGMLDVMYGEDTHIRRLATGEAQHTTHETRARMIRRFPALNAARSRSFDITDKSLQSMPGVKQLVMSLYGCMQPEETPLINVFSRYNLRLISEESFYNDLHGVLKTEFIIVEDKQQLENIARIELQYEEHSFLAIRKKLHLLWQNVIFEGLLQYGISLSNYKIYSTPGRNGYFLLFRQPGKKEWINMGFFFEKETLVHAANYLCIFLNKLYRRSITFYVIEHILLDNEPENDAEHNLLSIVIPGWIKRDKSTDDLQSLIEERLPAHLQCNFYHPDADTFFSYEKIYFQWRKALADNDTERIKAIKEKLEFRN